MTIYDGVMALIVVYTVIHGFWRGAAWQIAPIVSLVAGYMIAMPMSVTAAHWFGQPPLNRLFALVSIYILVSLTVYLFFRSFREGVEKAKLTEFDRHFGAILGGLKGLLVTLSATCILLIYVPPSREIILKSESSSIAAKLISTIYPVLPHAMHVLLEPYLHKLGDQLHIDLQDPHEGEDGFKRPATSARRAPRTPTKRTRDDSELQLEPTPQDDGFEQPIQRSRPNSRTPTLLEDDQFTTPTRRDDYPLQEPVTAPTTSRPKRPVPRSAEEDDPFEAADPNKAAGKFR